VNSSSLLRLSIVMAGGIHGLSSLSAKAPIWPSEFHIVSVSFSDFGPSFYYRVLDVKQDGTDSVVRYTRIAPVNIAYCPRQIVQTG